MDRFPGHPNHCVPPISRRKSRRHWVIATEGRRSMRIISALIGAGLAVSVATAVAAQTTPAPTTNPNTKVYAYKQTAPKQANPSTNATSARQQKPFEHNPDVVPYGSPKWWEINGRSN